MNTSKFIHAGTSFTRKYMDSAFEFVEKTRGKCTKFVNSLLAEFSQAFLLI